MSVPKGQVQRWHLGWSQGLGVRSTWEGAWPLVPGGRLRLLAGENQSSWGWRCVGGGSQGYATVLAAVGWDLLFPKGNPTRLLVH